MSVGSSCIREFGEGFDVQCGAELRSNQADLNSGHKGRMLVPAGSCVKRRQPVKVEAMPRYLTSHTMACMTRQGAQQLAASLVGNGSVEFLRFLVNMTEGKLFGEFEAPSREALVAWMEQKKIHYDWLARVDIEATPKGVRDL